MSDNVEPEEAAAIRDLVVPALGAQRGHVEPRNFSVPRRVSADRLQRLGKLVTTKLQGIGSDLGVPLRAYHKLSMGSVDEVNANSLFDNLVEPFLVLGFECRGQPGWLVWEPAAAIAATEVILSGSVDETAPERRLTPSECGVVMKLLARVLSPVAGVLGFEVQNTYVAQNLVELTSLEDVGPDADNQRLSVHLAFDGPGGPSDLRLYLPGIAAETNGERGLANTPLPEHLEKLPLELAAYLGTVDVPLTDLLKLEVGDVIPLGVKAGTPVELYVEDRACAKARLGTNRGDLAVQIEEIDLHVGEIEQPTQ